MNEKFDMKLVIDAVTTPLLHERLCAARSYRERAAILRSLAESALRVLSAASPSTAGTGHPGGSAQIPRTTGISIESVASSLDREPLSGTTGDGHDVVALADEFATFLGTKV
jgi:hypothetical protein